VYNCRTEEIAQSLSIIVYIGTGTVMIRIVCASCGIMCVLCEPRSSTICSPQTADEFLTEFSRFEFSPSIIIVVFAIILYNNTLYTLPI